MRSRPRSTGFTLIEVMVALIIVALALTTMSVTMARMLDTATTMRDRTYGSWIAQNKIVEMRASGTIPEPGITSGEVEFARGNWTWEATVAETGVENLLRVDVAISRPGTAYTIKTVTGFVGEPAIPGLANNLWTERGGEESGAFN